MDDGRDAHDRLLRWPAAARRRQGFRRYFARRWLPMAKRIPENSMNHEVLKQPFPSSTVAALAIPDWHRHRSQQESRVASPKGHVARGYTEKNCPARGVRTSQATKDVAPGKGAEAGLSPRWVRSCCTPHGPSDVDATPTNNAQTTAPVTKRAPYKSSEQVNQAHYSYTIDTSRHVFLWDS